MKTNVATQSVIHTKLYPPSLPDDCVTRGRLINILDQALEKRLTVVSAPAGYGKSVLVSEWSAKLDCHVVWLSLDETDGDIREFLAYLIAGVEESLPDALPSVEALLGSAEVLPLKLVATCLVNDLDSLQAPIAIILDDFHRLENNSDITQLLPLLLEYLPPNLHIIILSRRGLPVGLDWLRAANQLLEIRLDELRFSSSETAAFMGAAVNTALADSTLQLLDEEIEGWPVGLRLVALLIRQSSDPTTVLRHIHGGIPQTQDYMLREVLAGLSPVVKSCLLKSSILDRFSASLIDAVCLSDDSAVNPGLDGDAFIDAIKEFNLFAYSLDSAGQWYRFHHWFQYMLEHELRQITGDDEIYDLHLLAADWMVINGLPGEAITHFMEAQQPDKAADLIVQNFHGVLESNRWFVIDRWISVLPPELRQGRIDLWLVQAWIGFCKLDVEQVSSNLIKAEQLLAEQGSGDELACQFDFFRGWVTFWEGDLVGAEWLLRRCLNEFSVTPGMIAGEVRLYISFAQGMTGHYSDAVRFLAEERAAAGPSAGAPFLMRVIGGQTHLYYMSGDLDAATATVDRMRLISGFNSSDYAVGWAGYLNGLQEFSRGEFASASVFFAEAEKHINLLERRAAVDLLAGSCLAAELSGNHKAVTTAWCKLEQFVRNYEVTDCFWVPEAIGARLTLLNGNSASGLNWAKSVIVPETSLAEALFWIVNTAVTRARLLVLAADADADAVASGLQQLNELLERYRTVHNYCQIIDIQPIRAVALAKLGRDDEALQALGEAVEMASPGNWRRAFIELGEPVYDLLRRLETTADSAAFVQALLRDSVERGAGVSQSQLEAGQADSRAPSVLDRDIEITDLNGDGLTNRELDILELLEQRLQNKEIAAKLSISPHTVGYHLKHIYQKLDVSTRRQAVNKAHVVGLLTRS